MIKLNKTNYYKLLPLAKDIKNNKALIYSMINGDLDAEIFADNNTKTTIALLSWEFSFLLGSEKNLVSSQKICDLIFDNILPELDEKELILFLDKNRWPLLSKLLKEKSCITIYRKMFIFDKTKFSKMKINLGKLPEGLFVSPMKTDSANTFGYCIKKGTNDICKCESVAVGSKEAEIDIWTNEKYRNKGYATITAASFIDHCLKEGIKPIWSCWPYRTESINLAKKLGFVEAEEIPVIYWAEDM